MSSYEKVINMKIVNARDLLVKIVVYPIAAYGLWSLVSDRIKK
jgi:Na+-transporting NADH:ubiquinone oxidoreductase subunit NqrC